MVKENIITIENKKAQIVEIREIENYQENWFSKTFLSKTYCCKNSLCGCSCSSYTCNCASVSVRIEPTGTGFSASGKGKTDMNYAWGKGQYNHSLFSDKDNNGETRFLSTTIGGEIEANPIGVHNLKLKAGFNLIEHKSGGVEARLGVNVDSGGSINKDGVEAKFLGFGISAGKKKGEFQLIRMIALSNKYQLAK